MSDVRAGVVVPTRDGGERFRRCAAALASQRPAPAGWVVIDSGSRDGTDAVAREAGATVLSIPPGEFDHGLTRNAGADALPEVDAIVFLVQDAVPQADDFVDVLARAALADGVAAATARQVAPPDAGFLTRATVAASPFASGAPRRTGPFPPADLDALTPARRRQVVLLDDVACAVRADAFATRRFEATMHGEDALLAWSLLRDGWALAHEPRAIVEHGHEYEPADAERRYYDDAVFFRRHFGYRVRPGLLAALKGYLAQRRADRAWLAAHPEDDGPDAARRSRRLRRAQVRGQWRGSRGPIGPAAG